jgi:hypothetical protein
MSMLGYNFGMGFILCSNRSSLVQTDPERAQF